MRTIILNVAVSLDGFIAGPNGEFDWCFTDQDYGMADFMNSIDTIFYGRKSYELMLTMEEDLFKDQTRYVFSQTLDEVVEGYQLLKGDLKTEVERIRAQEGKKIWLFGGTSLASSFLEAGLINELFLAVHPLLLGTGMPLFEGIADRTPLKLVDSKTYDSGMMQLLYRIE